MCQLIGPGDLIIVSWKNLRKNIRAYSEIVLWYVLLNVIQWTILVILETTVADKIDRLMSYALLSIPVSLVFAVLTAATIDLTAKSLEDEKYDLTQSLHHGFHRLIPFIWVSILTSAAIFFGFVLLIVPAIIFFVWYKFAPYFSVVDSKAGFASLKASRGLTTGRWWAVFVRVVVPVLFYSVTASLLLSICYLILGLVFGDPKMFFGNLPDMSQLSRTHTLITTIVPQTIRGFAMILALGSDIALWLDLKRNG